MAPRIGPSDAERYGWPGVPAGKLAETCGPIARQIVRSGARSVGLVPAAGALPGGRSLAPLVAALGEALLGFSPQDVGLVDSWPTWPWGEAAAPDLRSIYRQRRLAPRIVEIAPLPCGDPQAATAALQATLASRPPGLAVVLVNLAEYTQAGVVPPAVDFLDGAIVVVALRRTLAGGLSRMAHFIPAAKNLGVVLVG
jgi:hypothetical protein